MTITIVLLIVLAIVVFTVFGAKKSGGKASDDEWPLYAKKVLSQPEQVLYFRLVKALPDNFVLAQVQLSRILGVKKGNGFQAWNNRINRMSADFVICNKDASVAAVIELDDASHERSDRQIADTKKYKALVSAGVRVIRWQVKAFPDEAAIRASFSA